MPVITLTADGKKKYIPLNENGEFFLTELRGIVSFDDIKEAERLAAGDMSDRSREVCCDINSIGEYDKINGLWEFSGGVARCMENCGRAAAESAFFHRWVSLNKKSGYLKNRLAAGETLTAKNSGLAAEFTKTARETVLAGLSDEPVWDYIMGAIKSRYIPRTCGKWRNTSFCAGTVRTGLRRGFAAAPAMRRPSGSFIRKCPGFTCAVSCGRKVFWDISGCFMRRDAFQKRSICFGAASGVTAAVF